MKIAGVLFIVLGVLALVYGGFRYAYPDNIVDAGPLQVTVTRHKVVPISPILGTLAVIGGVVLLGVGRNAPK